MNLCRLLFVGSRNKVFFWTSILTSGMMLTVLYNFVHITTTITNTATIHRNRLRELVDVNNADGDGNHTVTGARYAAAVSRDAGAVVARDVNTVNSDVVTVAASDGDTVGNGADAVASDVDGVVRAKDVEYTVVNDVKALARAADVAGSDMDDAGNDVKVVTRAADVAVGAAGVAGSDVADAGNDVKAVARAADVAGSDVAADARGVHPKPLVTTRASSQGEAGGLTGYPATEDGVRDVSSTMKRRRSIVYSCNKISVCGGWADRQKGIVSAYVLSVLMDRAFKLDMPRPCDIAIFLAPNQVDWVLTPEETEGKVRSDVEGIDSHGYDLVNRMMRLDDLSVPEMDADYVFITWNMELVHMLRKHRLARSVPWLNPKVSLAEIYRHVLKKLFYPTATLRNRMEEVQQSRPPNTKLACAQIRMGQSADFKDSESFNSLEAVQNLVGFLRQFNDSARYRILFASDNVQALKLGRDKFPVTFLETTGPITHVDKYQGQDACAGFGRAIVDQSLLSTCDVLVISESGLGKIAAFLRNSDDGLYLFHNSKISKFRRDLNFPNRFYW